MGQTPHYRSQHPSTERDPAVTQPLRRLLAGLSLTAVTLTGSLALAGTAAATTPPDTAWGTPVPTDGDNAADDTAWGTPPTTGGDGADGPSVTPFDTAWG